MVLVTSGEKPLVGMSEPFRDLAIAHLRKIGVEVLVSQRVARHEDGEVSCVFIAANTGLT